MRDVINMGVFLLMVSSVAGLGVGYVNSMTSPVIEKQAIKAKKDSFREVFPDGEEVKDETSKYLKKGENPLIKEVDVAYRSGTPVGVIYLVEPKGYGGTIKVMAGFDIATGKITAIKVLSQMETPGLGAKSKESFFQDRYKGKSAAVNLEVTKTPPAKDNQIQAITASTITSRAVTRGVNAARGNFMSNFVE